jgi:hypothetical protein
VIERPVIYSEMRRRAVLVAVEHDWLSGVHDSTTLARVLAPDFRHLLPTGQVITKAENIAWAVSNPAPKDQSSRFERLGVGLFGNVAVADGVVARRDSSGHVLARSAFTDVFVKRNGRWLAVHAQETDAGHADQVKTKART